MALFAPKPLFALVPSSTENALALFAPKPLFSPVPSSPKNALEAPNFCECNDW